VIDQGMDDYKCTKNRGLMRFSSLNKTLIF
jgi:hypothetical protein